MNARGWLVLVLAIVLLTTLCKAAEPVRLVVTLSCDDKLALLRIGKKLFKSGSGVSHWFTFVRPASSTHFALSLEGDCSSISGLPL
jgi:hypothetical protein